MRLNTGESSNVQDRRGMGGMAVGGGLGAVVLALVALFLGVDPADVGVGGEQAPTTQGPGGSPGGGVPGTAPADDEQGHFIKQVLRSTELTWGEIFQQMGKTYQEPSLILFSGSTSSSCGYAQSAMGPFYCPRDQDVYIDLAFYDELTQRFHAPGQFAEAYVVAHEVGHHVQNLLGVSEQVEQAERAAGTRAERNAYSVALELQADCFAGVWANHANRAGTITIESGDVESALTAASAIGDDKLQQESQGHVVPDSFTHGSSAQRVSWFRRGLEGGDMRQCDTFNS